MRNKSFCIQVDVGFYCNYKCSYCHQTGCSEKDAKCNGVNIEDYYEFSIKRLNNIIDNIYKIKDYLKYRIDSSEKFEILFVGGEPTLVPVFDLYKKICDTVGIHANRVLLTTNLSHDYDYFINLYNNLREYDNSVLGITASFHEEFADYDEFFGKVLKLKENDIIRTVQFTVNNNNYSLLDKIITDDKLYPITHYHDGKNGILVAEIERSNGYRMDMVQLNENALEVWKKYLDCRGDIKVKVKEKKYDFSDISTPQDDKSKKVLKEVNLSSLYCSIPSQRLNIYHNGDIGYKGKFCDVQPGVYDNLLSSPYINLPLSDYKKCYRNDCPLAHNVDLISEDEFEELGNDRKK